MPEIILTLSCIDRPGIVAAVSTFLAERDFTISDSQQFGDEDSGRFFMRLRARTTREHATEVLRANFSTEVADPLDMRWAMKDPTTSHRILVMVSKQEHCLNDLLHRVRTGALQATIVAVVSNHPDLRGLVEWHGIPFHHIPVTKDSKTASEDELRRLVAEYDAETVVLARYMQILSDALCGDLEGRAINIHHSLLPSFKGARPYFQAHARGVKVVGATAHYVTAELDEGPIIDQEFGRVDHSASAQRLTEIGKDMEALALARAVAAHAEQRVILNGSRTVVFRG